MNYFDMHDEAPIIVINGRPMVLTSQDVTEDVVTNNGPVKFDLTENEDDAAGGLGYGSYADWE